MTEFNLDDVAEMRKQGDLRAFLRQAAGRSVDAPPAPAPLAAVPDPGYRIAHVGGWPLGTAASGPTPPPGVCTCAKCGGNPNSPAVHREAAA